MKHSLLRIFLSASLAFMPFSPGMAAVTVTSDEDLGAVSAKGFEGQGVLGQQNNYSAVQALGTAQWGAAALSIQNVVDSTINVHQDVADLKDVEDVWTFSKNCQSADNASWAASSKFNKRVAKHQNNNQGSVQFGDSAQFKASALAIVNAADAAGNVYQKLRKIENADDVALLAFSNQKAWNSGTFDQAIVNKRFTVDQNNNNASVQVVAKAQQSTSSVALVNAAASVQNVSQMWTGIKNSEDIFLLKANNQYAANDVVAEQRVISIEDNIYVNNNNGSTEFGDEGQSLAESFAISNAAMSAVNIGQNLAYAESVKGLSAIQINDQYATNRAEAVQTVMNIDDVWVQNNNNASVHVQGYAQASSQLGVLVNAAGSAVNEGLNVVSASLATGRKHHGHGDPSYFTQTNGQYALNGAADLIGVQNDQVVAFGQKVINWDDVGHQNNNFGAVQLDGYAQNWISAVAVTNAAASAVNVGQNFAFLAGGGHFVSICQFNDQTATNYVYDSTQLIWNWDEVANQNNNNASVQITDGGQNCVDVVSLVNVAAGAANIGQNLASITGGKEVRADQTNYQDARATSNAAQSVYNFNGDEVEYQNNNNSSVQIAGSQNKVTSNSILNAAASAVNIGQNLAQASVSKEAFVQQYNGQYAQVSPFIGPAEEAFSASSLNAQVSPVSDQYVKNAGEAEYQYNNNGSVQLADSQNETKGLSILNAAASAVNVGQNIAALEAKGAKVYQANGQTATFDVAADPTVKNRDEVEDQYNNASSVFGTGSGSQKQVQVLSLANIARSAANIGQNVADVKAEKWTKVKQNNDQFAELYFEGWQTVYNDDEVTAQNNNNASVQGDDLQNSMTAASIINAAVSAVNLGQNIANLDGGKWTKVKQINKQYARVEAYLDQEIDNDEAVAGQNNNNASVQLIGSQSGVKAISIANVAVAAANVGQNIAKANAGKELELKQVNVQYAAAYTGGSQEVLNDDTVAGQNSNLASVQLISSQNDTAAVSIVNTAASAVNVGQNIAAVSGGFADVHQVNIQTADDPGTVAGNTENRASVQNSNSQNGVEALSVLDAAVSAANVGQNVAGVNAKFAYNKQINKQEAFQETPVGLNTPTTGSVRATDSENGLKALSAANVAVSAVNVGQNIAKVKADFGAGLDQVNKQYALFSLPTIESATSDAAGYNMTAIQLAGSQNDSKALSLLNASFSAVNVGQNVAKVDAGFFAHVDQVNCQAAILGGGNNVPVATAEAANSNSNGQAGISWSIGLSNSQNNTSALSLVNAAASLVNVGQNVAKVDSWKLAHVDQANYQSATVGLVMDGAATSSSGNGSAQTSGSGLIDLAGSQNCTSALSIVNAVASAVNVGMNIAVVEGKYADIHQTNFQCAIATPIIEQNGESTTTSTSAMNSGSSAIRLADSQVNASALAIVNAVGSAVNIGRNIAVMNGVRGGSVTQMNFQNAYR